MAINTLNEVLSIFGWPDSSSLPESDTSFSNEDAYIVMGLPAIDFTPTSIGTSTAFYFIWDNNFGF